VRKNFCRKASNSSQRKVPYYLEIWNDFDYGKAINQTQSTGSQSSNQLLQDNLYAKILMQLVHRNLFLVKFDFSFQRRMFLEPSDYEAFTLNCSMYLKFLSQFVWKCSIRQLQTQIVFKNILRGIFTLKRSMYRKFLLTFEKILLLSFSSTATHFDITKRITNHLRKHFGKNLISEGTTSHWVEYNDGCAQRYGIHSLLFVIILFSHLIFLLRSNRYMVCSTSLFHCPILFQQFLVRT